MSTDATSRELALDSVGLDDDLLAKTRRLGLVYGVVLALLVGSILASYSVLDGVIATQRRLSALEAQVNDIALGLADSIGIMADYRSEQAKSRSNPRVRHLIRTRLASALEQIDLHKNALLDTADELRTSRRWSDIGWIVDNSPDGLHYKLGRYLTQLRIVVAEDDADAVSDLPMIPADAAGAKDGALSQGYLRASEQLTDMFSEHSTWLARVHAGLTSLVTVSMLLTSLLVVIPLWRGLVREHHRVRRSHEALKQLALFDRETGLPNLHGLAREARSIDASRGTGEITYLFMIRITNMDDLYNLVGRQHGQDFHASFSDRLERLPFGDCRWSRAAESEYVSLLDRDTVLRCADWMTDVYTTLTAAFRINGVLVGPRLKIAASPIGARESMQAELLFEHQTRAGMASQSFDPAVCELKLYDVGLTEKLLNWNELLEQISVGLERNEFIPHYQIKVDAQSGRPSSLEALCRWRHANGSIDGPGTFIEAAERSGHIVPLTYQLMDQVTRDIKSWTEGGLSVGHVSVNFSAEVLLHHDMLDKLARCLRELPSGCSGLEIEVTENVALGNGYERIRETLAVMRDMGVRISIDDFGTGYASMQTLTELPYDILKIDRCFVELMREDGSGFEVISAMISLAGKMNKPCVVEGVETLWQWNELKAMGADELQGYLFHHPVSARETRDWLTGCQVMRATV